jgi:hypothetical protein
MYEALLPLGRSCPYDNRLRSLGTMKLPSAAAAHYRLLKKMNILQNASSHCEQPRLTAVRSGTLQSIIDLF